MNPQFYQAAKPKCLRRRCRRRPQSCMSVPVRQKPVVGSRVTAVRVKSVIRPWCARAASAALCFTSTICRLWLPPCEPPRDLPPRDLPPRTNATRTNTRRTPHRKRPNAERTTDEHRRARSTSDPLKDDSRGVSVFCPMLVHQVSVRSPNFVRCQSVSCLCAIPRAVRNKPVVCP